MYYDSSEDEAIIKGDLGSNSDGSGNKIKSGPIYVQGRKSSGEVSSDDSVSLEDFKIVRFISKGTFGSVFLAFLPNNDKYYAIKCMNKNELLQKDLIESVKLEKLIMLEVEHPFVVRM